MAVVIGERVRPDELDPDELSKGEKEAVAPSVINEDKDTTLLAVGNLGEGVPKEVREWMEV